MWRQDNELVKGVTRPSHYTNSLWVRSMCWNFLGQTDASRGEGFPMFQRLTLSPSSRCCWWFGRTTGSFGSTKPPATPWRRGHGQSLKRPEKLHILPRLSAWENFTEFCHHESFRTCKENVSVILNSRCDHILNNLHLQMQLTTTFKL
jgi:hypothetical protein